MSLDSEHFIADSDDSDDSDESGSEETDDGIIQIDDEDDSSGFGSFDGFNLNDDLSDPESNDEIELPGKTFECAQFCSFTFCVQIQM